jgi:clan AA aspartic protease
MGFVKVIARIGATEEDLREVEFMVDTGTFFTVLPDDLFNELGLQARHRERVVTADNRGIFIEIGSAHIEIEDRATAVLVGRMNTPMPLLGVAALEALGFKVNPIDGTLEPDRPFPGVPVL